MDWYYAREGQQQGPVSEMTLARLREEGVITEATLVWNASMADWQPLSKVLPGASYSVALDTQERCCECGRIVGAEELVRFREDVVCPECKDLYFLRVYQGTDTPGKMEYAPMWKRFVARFLDTLLFSAAAGLVAAPAIFLAMFLDPGEETIGILVGIFYLTILVLNAVYEIWFTGRYGATPGKMAMGLEVVVEDGSKVSYLRATGRFFGNLLTANFTFYIGYLIAVPDTQKRTLHDYICSTRVIIKAP